MRGEMISILIPEMKQADPQLSGRHVPVRGQCCLTSGGREPTRQFSEGSTAMHIVFSNYASEMIHNPESEGTGAESPTTPFRAGSHCRAEARWESPDSAKSMTRS